MSYMDPVRYTSLLLLVMHNGEKQTYILAEFDEKREPVAIDKSGNRVFSQIIRKISSLIIKLLEYNNAILLDFVVTE